MREGELIYFTPAEYIVVMELAEGEPYSLLQCDGMEPDDAALEQAFASLYKRGLILRTGERFELSDSGREFAAMRSARFAVQISAGRNFAAACYVSGEELWTAELVSDILSQRFRVQRLGRKAAVDWLLDAEVLPRPKLSEQDAAELAELFADELSEPSGRVVAKLERHFNGGERLCGYELVEGKVGAIAVRSDAQERTAWIYTEQALERLLTECFGGEEV